MNADQNREMELIDRLVCGGAAEDWDAFREVAGHRIEPWRRLAEEQRLARLLGQGVAEESAGALRVELPGGRLRGWFAARQQLGWAAAILLALGWAATMVGNHVAREPIPTALPVAAQAPRDLLTAYLGQSHVMGELPIQVSHVELTADGETITYIRPILERQVVRMYEVASDEGSNVVLREQTSGPTGTRF